MLMWNDGTGHFRERGLRPGLRAGRSSAAARPSPTTTTTATRTSPCRTPAGPLQLLRNDGEHGHWLGVELVGRKSNRQGIGARLVAETPGGKKLTRFVQAGSSYLSSSDPRVLFGLGGRDVGQEADDLLAVGHRRRSSRTWPAGKYVKIEEK